MKLLIVLILIAIVIFTFVMLKKTEVVEPSMKIEKTDKTKLIEYITDQVMAYSKKQKSPVYYIAAGYNLDQEQTFSIYFDTRANAEPDGTWTLHLKDNTLNIGTWQTLRVRDYNKIVRSVGDLIKEVMIQLRNEGLFLNLDTSKKCIFGVENMLGEYGWPVFEDNGKENLIKP